MQGMAAVFFSIQRKQVFLFIFDLSPSGLLLPPILHGPAFPSPPRCILLVNIISVALELTSVHSFFFFFCFSFPSGKIVVQYSQMNVLSLYQQIPLILVNFRFFSVYIVFFDQNQLVVLETP